MWEPSVSTNSTQAYLSINCSSWEVHTSRGVLTAAIARQALNVGSNRALSLVVCNGGGVKMQRHSSTVRREGLMVRDCVVYLRQNVRQPSDDHLSVVEFLIDLNVRSCTTPGLCPACFH